VGPVKPTVALVKSVAKKIVADAQEDKYDTKLLRPSGVPVNKAGDITASDVELLLPPITQGSNTNQRVGDKLKVKKMRVDVILTTSPNFGEAFLSTVRFMILEDKSNKDNVQIPTVTAPIVANSLLENGSGQQGFTGRNMDLMYRINTRRFKVHCDKKLTLGKASEHRLAPGVGTPWQISQISPGTYKFSVKIRTPKTLIYQSATSTSPTNFAPFMVVGYAFNESNHASDPAELTNQRIVYNTLTHLDYEDA